MSIDLTTRYLGFDLPTPVIASAGPVTGDPDMWPALAAAGVGAVVLPSLFEEDLERESDAVDAWMEGGAESFGEATGFFPDLDLDLGADRHLRRVAAARDAFDVPVIASLNGTSAGGWVHYARRLVDAGAHAIELNLYDIVTDPAEAAADVERRDVDLVAAVRAEVDVPVAVKISPWYTAPVHVARRLEAAGANAIVAFNRFYQPEIDLETLEVRPVLHLSTSAEVALRAHWIGILRDLVGCSLAGTGGVHRPEDAVRLLLAGADAVMTTASLIVNGPGHVAVLVDGIRAWMEAHDYDSVGQLVGSVSRHNAGHPHGYERANYARTIEHGIEAPPA